MCSDYWCGGMCGDLVLVWRLSVGVEGMCGDYWCGGCVVCGDLLVGVGGMCGVWGSGAGVRA